MNGQLIDTKKLVEALLGDLRLLSQEAKKKQNHVKEAAESGVVRIRNISTASSNEQILISNLRAACSELLHPLVLGCATRVTKLVQISLQGIQRLIQHRILSSNGATIVTNELWGLVEQECEELRVLQTVPPLVSSELVVTGNTLAKCIVMCFRLHHAKDPIVINAASASIRQLVSTVFERVIQEDGIFSTELQVIPPTGRVGSSAPPPTLRPCAADAFMLFRDLCLFINGEAPIWLIGIREMTRTLGLELLESVLKGYPSVFIRHSEFGQLLKEDVCPLIIRLFSPSLKAVNVASQHPNSRSQYSSSGQSTVPAQIQQSFPITMRLVRIVTLILQFYQNILHTECEIFIATLLKFVEGDRRGWQRPLALEALHRVVTRADLVRWMTETFDCQTNSTNVLEKVANGLSGVVQQCLTAAHISSSDQDSEIDRSQEDGGPGFYVSKNLWIPYVEHLTAKKSILLDSLDRMDATNLPEGYILSRSLVAICDMTQAIYTTIDSVAQDAENSADKVAEIAYRNAQPAILSAISSLLTASTDEVVTDQLLCCLSTLISSGCCVNQGATRDNSQLLAASVYTLATLSMPSPTYLRQFAAITDMPAIFNAELDAWPSTAQVIATGPPCPCPCVATELWNRQVLLTSKNMQAARTFLGAITTHMTDLKELWYLCLATCQHLTWLLAMRPGQNGIFERETRDSEGSGQTMVTTAAMSDIGMISSLIDKIAPSIAHLKDEQFVEVIDAVVRLSDESLAVAATGRESTHFPLALLYRICYLSLPRLELFWSKSSSHFIKVCNHTSVAMRDWAAVALTSLAKQAMKAKTAMDVKTQQEACISSILALCQIPHFQVRRRQLDCVMSLMQTDGTALLESTWPNIIHIISAIIDNETGCELSLIRQGFSGLKLVSSDFLQNLPFDNLSLLIESISKYAKQHTDQNISLSALALLWTISDFIYRTNPGPLRDSTWMVLYTCLAESCVDQRFAVRKSACQTLLQIVTAHGHALLPESWNRKIWHILIPLLDKVRANLKSASTEKIGESATIIMHHSRDTEQKQWIETCILTIGAITKIFNSQRANLTQLADFAAIWEAYLSYLEWAGCYENAELSLAAIRAYQEVLLGKVSNQTLNVNMHQASDSAYDIQPPELPQAQWVEAWKTWLKIARGLAKQGVSALSMSTSTLADRPMLSSRTSASSLVSLSASASATNASQISGYIPGPSHLTAILNVFPPLFNRVAKSIPLDDLKYESLPAVLESMMNVPIPSEQAPFVLPSASTHLTPTQEALVEAVKNVYVECTMSGNTTTLRNAVPDLIRLLLRFASLATARIAPNKVAPGGQKSYREYALTTIVPFSEYSLRMAIEFFVSTSSTHSPPQELAAISMEIVRFLAEPLHLKYGCISATTWKLAATSLMTCLRTAIPLARLNPEYFGEFWPAICETMEKWIFTPNKSTRLAADERKRDELMECQAIEIIRAEMLAYAAILPPQDVQRIIALLHRGSISQVDSTDVLGLDTHTQRNELAKSCFDALLMSTASSSATQQSQEGLGNVAVASLMQRCTQVMSDFCRDFSSSGDLRLPRSRFLEIISALQAIDQLIERLARDPRLTELYSQLVSLFPTVVDIVPCSHSDAELARQLVATIKSYQTLFLKNLENSGECGIFTRFLRKNANFLQFSGTTTDLEIGELEEIETEEQIVDKILEQSGSWSIVYFNAKLKLLFIGRDVFGRQSLVFNFAAREFAVSVAKNSRDTWIEVPFGQVTVIRANFSAQMYSYLDEYPEGVCEDYAQGFAEFAKAATCDKKLRLLNVSREIEGNVVDDAKELREKFLGNVVSATRNLLRNTNSSHLAVCLSGGVDSTFVAHVAHLSATPETRIDLINVAFGENAAAYAAAPDRARAIAATASLRTAYPNRQFRLIFVNVNSQELEEMRKLYIADAARPATSVLDDSLACVLWFAVRARGCDAENGEHVESPATTLLLGSGADELLAGYARHRTRFEKDGDVRGVAEECEQELRRLGARNGGRDARVAAQLGKTILSPILEDNVVEFLNSLPGPSKWDLSLPRGIGEKRVLRELVRDLGSPHSAPKQAMQFGSRMAKMSNAGDNSIKGSDKSPHLHSGIAGNAVIVE
ncbi:unnamed protein product [Caenorhabditis angaria]|uniref:Protein MON2 homolog n=1 Tax=Caenorhabditis angaria TaxID=860376 RepID=A0A9P1N4E7_9PELO|nr:unnamed protein product [Caenorhabditis angaria]